MALTSSLHLVTTAVVRLAESGESEGGISPWVVGVGAFLLLVALLVALVTFGGGREHS